MTKILTALIFINISSYTFANIDYNFYGFIKAGLSNSDNGLKSFGSDGFRAPTEASNQNSSVAVVAGEDTQSQNSIQSAQTRWGVKIKKGERLKGILEFDGAANNGSPSAGANIRLRQAHIHFKLSQGGSFFAGQKWVTFAGLNPHTVNMVGAGFRSGNSGFIGNEFGYTHTLGDFKVYLTLGNKGQNSSVNTTDTELGVPAQTLRFDYNSGSHHLGLAYITGELKQKELNTATNKNSKVAGSKVFYSLSFDSVNFKAEYFRGHNLGDMGFLTLANSRVTDDKKYKESGLFASLKYSFKNGSAWIGYGQDKVNNILDYTFGSLVKNRKTNIAAEYNIHDSLNTYFSHERFQSYYLSTNNTAERSKANLTEVGFIYKF